jgi:hypothetical protein
VTELHDLIREKLDARAGSPLFMWHNQASAAIRAVLDIHKPYYIYEPCGHQHELTEDLQIPPGVRNVDDVGLVCDDGLLYTICFHCCAGDHSQTERCVSEHQHEEHAPCPTVRTIATQLGLMSEVES